MHPRSFVEMAAFRRVLGCVFSLAAVVPVGAAVVNVIAESAGPSADLSGSRAFEDAVASAVSVAKRVSARVAAGEAGARFRPQSFLNAASADAMGVAVADLVREADAGGYVAKRALQTLVSMTVDPDAKAAMLSAGALRTAEVLLSRPSSGEPLRGLAGSLVSLLTDAPVAAEVSNERTGSDGRVEIVLPRPSRVYAL